MSFTQHILLHAAAVIVSLPLSAYAEIYSFATTNNSQTNLPASITDEAGKLVSSSAIDEFGYNNNGFVALGSIAGSSFASTSLGVNRLGISSGLAYAPGPNGEFGIPGYIFSTAQSLWSDDWIFSGGEAGEVINGVIYGRTTFGLALSGPLILGTSSSQFQVEQTLQLIDGANSFNLRLDTVDFLAEATPTSSLINWSLEFTARSGFNMGVTSNFLASGNFCGISNLDGTYCGISFQSGSSLIFDRIEIDPGFSLTSTSGELLAQRDGFVYKAAVDDDEPDNSVSEPGALELMAIGLLFSWIVRRKYHQKRVSA